MKLSQTSVEWAMQSLAKRSDTDLFPRPIELVALANTRSKAAAEISGIDISQHQPGPSRRFIVPKDDLSYRAASQLDPLDSVILTSIIHEYGGAIEARRRPIGEKSVFSYRFAPSPDGDLYASQSAWNAFWRHCYALAAKFPYALMVDVADFYNQIYHHTIENELRESGLPNQVTKWVMRLVESVTAKVSRGIPVGPHATHLLAEAAMVPIDNSLAAHGIRFCRFVDDIVIFADSETTARAHLYKLAEILDKQQRLQLQKTKTRILSSGECQEYCLNMIEDRPINDLEHDLVGIIMKYSGGDPYRTVFLSQLSADDLRAFTSDAVEKVLSDYLAAEAPDFVRLRWFIRRLAQVGHPSAVGYCLEHFERMVPAVSEICHYFVAVAVAGGEQLDWSDVGAKLLDLLDNPLIQSNEYFQLSILSLFSRQTRLDHLARVLTRYTTSPPYVRREIILAAGEAGQADWLRELKTDVPAMDPWTRRAFLAAAKTLPTEERKFFLRFASPANVLEELIVNWAKA